MASLHNLRFRLAIAVFCVYVMCWVAGARDQQSLCMSLECMLCLQREIFLCFILGRCFQRKFIYTCRTYTESLVVVQLAMGFRVYVREVSKQTENNKLRALISYTRWDDIQARPSGGRVCVYVCVAHGKICANIHNWESGGIHLSAWEYTADTHMGGNAGPYQHLSRHTVNIPHGIYIYIYTHCWYCWLPIAMDDNTMLSLVMWRGSACAHSFIECVQQCLSADDHIIYAV